MSHGLCLIITIWRQIHHRKATSRSAQSGTTSGRLRWTRRGWLLITAKLSTSTPNWLARDCNRIWIRSLRCSKDLSVTVSRPHMNTRQAQRLIPRSTPNLGRINQKQPKEAWHCSDRNWNLPGGQCRQPGLQPHRTVGRQSESKMLDLQLAVTQIIVARFQ